MTAWSAVDEASAVRSGEELDASRLEDYLARQRPELAGELEVAQFPAGFSNLTYLVRSRRPGGVTTEMVLRRPPFGSNVGGAHDMGREYRILCGLDGVYGNAPKPLLFCEDEAVLGAPFYLMERLGGIILRGGPEAAGRLDADRMRRIGRSLVETLVELHGIDLAECGLEALGRPVGYITRQIEGWTSRWAAARIDEVPAMDGAADWLMENCPAECGATLIHNDFKYDNLVLAADDVGTVVGVLDWEMATVGDPLMDLGTTLGYWVDPDDPDELQALALSPTTLPGNPCRREVAEQYASQSGRDATESVFYYVYGLFKIGVIIQQIYYRYRQGLTRDPRFARLDEGVIALGAAARRSIEVGRL